jgi:hypothetical protein
MPFPKNRGVAYLPARTDARKKMRCPVSGRESLTVSHFPSTGFLVLFRLQLRSRPSVDQGVVFRWVMLSMTPWRILFYPKSYSSGLRTRKFRMSLRSLVTNGR